MHRNFVCDISWKSILILASVYTIIFIDTLTSIIPANIYTPTAFFNDEPIWSNCVHCPIFTPQLQSSTMNPYGAIAFISQWAAVANFTISYELQLIPWHREGFWLDKKTEMYPYNYIQIYFHSSELAQILSTVSNLKKINIFESRICAKKSTWTSGGEAISIL